MKDETILRLENLFLKQSNILFSGFVNKEENCSPQKIWEYVSCIGAKPSITFSEQSTQDASKYIWKLIQSFEFVSNSESKIPCLISIGGLGSLPWAFIELPLKSSILEIFAINEGCPEFIITNKSGDTFLAITSEEDQLWIYLLKQDQFGLITISKL